VADHVYPKKDVKSALPTTGHALFKKKPMLYAPYRRSPLLKRPKRFGFFIQRYMLFFSWQIFFAFGAKAQPCILYKSDYIFLKNFLFCNCQHLSLPTFSVMLLQSSQKQHKALLLDGEMFESLYKHEMEEHIGYWTEGMKKDKDDFVFAVTENNGHAAMVVITKNEELLINEPARAFLKKAWKKQYHKNIEILLPAMAAELAAGYFSVNRVKIV
jgi:hypothetical protein